MLQAVPMSLPLCVPGTVWWPCLSRGLPGSSRAGLGSCLTDLLLISLQKVRDLFCSLVWGLLLCLGFLAGCLWPRQRAAEVPLGVGGWANFGLWFPHNGKYSHALCGCSALLCGSSWKSPQSCQLLESQIAGEKICFPIFSKKAEQTMCFPRIHR